MTEENRAVTLFSDNSGSLMAQNDAAAVARATQEIQAALTIGQRFPRDEIRAKARIIEACSRRELAEVAEYEYSRGGTRITGPTIDLLRAVANRWGNIRFGWTEVERRDGYSMVRCFAWDVQSNGQAERTFSVKHWRDTQSGGYALTDERDIYEAMANQAARRVRACLEEVIDADVVDAAIQQCRKTLSSGNKESLKDRAVKMITAFAEFGVTQKQIEAKLGNAMEAVSENQLASLRRVYKSLKDGVGRREDYFKPETAQPNFAGDQGQAGKQPETAGTPTPNQPTAGVVGGGSPASDDDGDLGPVNPLARVRELCVKNKVKEGKLLEHLTASGTTDGSHSSLDELAIAAPNVVKLLVEQWDAVLSQIHGGGK